MRFIATGDAVVTRRFSVLGDPHVEDIRSLLQASDLAFTNLETALPALPATPAAVPQGITLAGGPFAIEELQWLGIGAVNYANNHILDYSLGGLRSALTVLEAAHLPFAGAGYTLTEARSPVFVDTAAGRLALIGACSSTAERSLASDPGFVTRGRPGINPLRFRTVYQVTEEQFRSIEEIDEALGTAGARRSRVAASLSRARGATSYLSGHAHGLEPAKRLEFAERDFVIGDEARVLTEPHGADLEAIVRSVDYARRAADVVAVSIHCHEGAHDGWNSRLVPDFLVTASHAWVDAGADVVIGHGPHLIRGIEIYCGKPIFYSLGNFIQTINTVSFLPPEAYVKQGLDPETATIADYFDAYPGFDLSEQFWLALLARLEITADGVSVEVLPLTLRMDEVRHRKGLPVLAHEEAGRKVLSELAALSEPFGTSIAVDVRDGQVSGSVSRRQSSP